MILYGNFKEYKINIKNWKVQYFFRFYFNESYIKIVDSTNYEESLINWQFNIRASIDITVAEKAEYLGRNFLTTGSTFWKEFK